MNNLQNNQKSDATPMGYDALLGAVNLDSETELKKRGWIEDKLMSGRYISPHTKITYTVEQACKIEDLF